MSDTVDETLEEFTIPGVNIAKNQVFIPIGAWNYLFEKQDDGSMKFLSRDVTVLSDNDEPEPFDPSEYR